MRYANMLWGNTKGVTSHKKVTIAEASDELASIDENQVLTITLPESIENVAETLTGWNPSAWYNEVTPSFDDATRTFSLTPLSPATTFEYFVQGVKYTKTGVQSKQITDVTGIHFLVYNGATLEETDSAGWLAALKGKTKCLVAAIYWNATHQVAILKSGEPHTWTISGQDHYWKHHTIGTRYGGGLVLSIAANNWQLDVTEGEIFDEDIDVLIKDSTTVIFGQNLTVLESKKLYREGLAEWHYDNAIPANIVFLTSGNKIQYNINTAGTWTLGETAVNKYSAMWLIATNDFDDPVICVLGQGETGTLAAARAGNDYADMNLSGLPTAEFRLLGRVIVKGISASPYYEIVEIEQMQNDDIIPGGDVTNDSYVTAANFDTGTKTLTLTRNNGLAALPVEIPYPESTPQVNGLGMSATAIGDLGLPSEVNSTTENVVTENSHTHKLGKVHISNISAIQGIGALYNWDVTQDVRAITSSDDWDVWNDSQMFALLDYIDTFVVDRYPFAGDKLSATTIKEWYAPSNLATNQYKFNAIGSGYRNNSNGAFYGIGETFCAWGIEADFETSVRYIMIEPTVSYVRHPNANPKNDAYSIRLVRPATEAELLLPDGLISATYVGNNLINYPLTKIGTQIWLACNLNETKYRNGDWITGFEGGVYTPISNAAWAALTTEAMCYYSDNEAYGGGETPLTAIITALQTNSHPPVTIHVDSTAQLEIDGNQVLKFTATIPELGIEDIAFEFCDVVAGTAKEYTLDIKASFGYTIEAACLETDNGTLTGVAVKIGSTAVTGLSAVTVDTAVDETAATGANTVAENDRVTLAVAATYTGTPTLIRGKLKIQRI